MSQSGIDASDELLDLLFAALDHGIGSVQSSGGPLTPFVMVNQGGKRAMRRFVAQELSEGVELARQSVATLPASVTAYAIACDSFITVEGQKYDAITVEAGERGKSFSLIFAQRYRPAGARPFETIGNPAYLGQDKQRLR